MFTLNKKEWCIISRKSCLPEVSRINDETVTMARLRQITGLLLDIHGQHEHQSLLYKSKHLEILDAYVKANRPHSNRIRKMPIACILQLKERLPFASDQETRLREKDFLRFEIEEIENAALKDGEEEKVAADFNAVFQCQNRIAESLSQAYDA